MLRATRSPRRAVGIQGENFEELLENLYEAVEGCLSVDVSPTEADEGARVMDIAI